ncbi:MAG: right-handed parallel beta-helix repeat-containing protein [Nanoarchaeota archaeon]|nr:right-handed parallel beta-helix repeat-containing protein [Nanoarchaeota archaeon]
MGKLIIFYLMLLLLPIAYAVCTVPDENIEVKENAVFCFGTYELKSGVNIVSDNILVDCNNSILLGDGLNYGIFLNNRHNVIIQNCNISNYEVGIYLENTNDSILSNNYATKNKFGIALFNSFNNNLNNNFLTENIKDDRISYLPVSLIQEERTEIEKKGEIITPQKILEEVISVKKPFLEQVEILNEVNSIFNNYFNVTQENLEINRTISYNESDKSTKIILHLKPKKVLLNVSIYEKIPKCVSTYVNQLLLETGGYEVINSDPLILWSFSKLDRTREISYKVFKNIDEECKNLLLAFGIATGFVEFEVKEEKKGKSNYILLFSVVISAVLIVYFILTSKQK